jgi:glycosyltransferase involved in cell wall biosynthesis
MRELGLGSARQLTLRNGVDLTRFQPAGDVAALRAQLGVAGSPLIVSVGNLLPVKGHDLAIEALARLRQQGLDARLCVIGAGPLRDELQALASQRGLDGEVRFLGALPQEQLAAWYGAADLLMLASEREGWPNVLLESMACGTPVVATSVGGIPEIVDVPSTGRLVAERSAAALADAVLDLWRDLPPRDAVCRHARQFGWHETTQGQLNLFQTISRTGSHA